MKTEVGAGHLYSGIYETIASREKNKWNIVADPLVIVL